MRILTVYAAAVLALLALQTAATSTAVAQGSCTGENCQQQNQGGRDCERSKNEDTVS